MNFSVVSCCPVPQEMAPILTSLQKKIPGLVYNSVYRGDDKGAARYLTGGAPCFKHTQRWIYSHYPPGVANPPGRSTHELRNDGVAYRGWKGMPLPWWCIGIDINDQYVDRFIEEARKLGWLVTRTYPSSTVEYHHVNFRKLPKLRKDMHLKYDDWGPNVHTVAVRLWVCGYLHKKDISWRFSHIIEAAVKRFQHQHHLPAWGHVGIDTWTKLGVEYRKKKKRK